MHHEQTLRHTMLELTQSVANSLTFSTQLRFCNRQTVKRATVIQLISTNNLNTTKQKLDMIKFYPKHAAFLSNSIRSVLIATRCSSPNTRAPTSCV